MNLSQGLEIIDHQRASKLKARLVPAIEKLAELTKDTGIITQELLDSVNLSKIIFDTIGIKTEVIADSSPAGEMNAYMTIPSVNGYHVFFNQLVSSIGFDDARRAFNQNKAVLTGLIDLENSKVSGYFSEIPHKLGIGSRLIGLAGQTPEELSAVIAHELGHAFTIMEMIHYLTTGNLVIQAGIQAIIKERDKRVQHALIVDIENLIGVPIPGGGDLIESGEYDKFLVTTLACYETKHPFSSFGEASRGYDMNMSEQMADMFSARHGFARAQVTGLAKMRKVGKTIYGKKTNLYDVISKSLSCLFAIMFAPITIYTFASTVARYDFFSGVYDRRKDRYIRLRNQVINSLKEPGLSDQIKQKAIHDIKLMDELISKEKNYYFFVEKVAFIFRSSQRARYREKLLQQNLEALMDNPLYVKAAELQLLGGK